MGSPPGGNNDQEDEKKKNNRLPEKAGDILRRIIQRKTSTASSSDSSGYGVFSTDAILKTARGMLLKRKNPNFEVSSIVLAEFFYTDESQKSDDLELALLFQAAALKLSNRQFDRAKWLINICQGSASPTGNALHRIVSYFSVALKERISKELGEVEEQSVPAAGEEANVSKQALANFNPELIKSYLLLPFCQLIDFTAIQAIVDNLASARRVHLIDLGMKTGSQWPILMQALAGRNGSPLELLRITAVGGPEDGAIGKMLASVAESMNIPFEFRLIVAELKDLKPDLFEVSDESEDEVLAVYSELRLSSLLPCPEQLVSLLTTIEKLNPTLMVVIEIEASTDAPVFLDRFDSALSVCAAVFECLEDCLGREDPCRAFVEGGFMWESVRNVITSEGEERVCRHERLDFWRGFMLRFGFLEVALSEIAFVQLNLVVARNPHWRSCTIEVNGKGIVVGWKGSPIKSLSVWKFHHD